MSIDSALLASTLAESWTVYSSGPTAVRTGRHITPLHRFCVSELVHRGFPASRLFPQPPGSDAPKRIRLVGGYMPKEIDVCLLHPGSGPLLAISVKSQLREGQILKNTPNRFEEYVGDATNLHARFPMLVLGFLMLIPVVPETFQRGRPSDGLKRIGALLERSNARRMVTEPIGSYEVSALLLADFSKDPPTVASTYPEKGSSLRIETFFDRLAELYRQRNQFVEL